MPGRGNRRALTDRSIDDRLRPYEDATVRLLRDALAPPADDPLGLVGASVGRYRVDELLAVGGMGVLYRATDHRLGRTVALKFLSPAVALDPTARQRFLLEARAASALDHPNVCAIYEVDETADGRPYIAMACYEGETLKSRIERGPIAVREAIDLVRQAAGALATAHARGLVHRDIKPGNLFVTGAGTLKILDFGIARTPGVDVTLPHQRPGTAAYMSPEQVDGRPVDGKADVWSLGLVLLQMLTGKVHPPTDRLETGLSEATSAGSIPAPVDGLLQGMLDRDPAARPSAEELTRVSAVELALAPATPGGWSPRGIAVLPFMDLSPAGDQEYLCEGMAEEILDALARVEGIRVTSRLSSRALVELPRGAGAIGRWLNVDTLVDGSIRKAGSRIRVTARLVRAADGLVLWSGRYDRDLEDVFAIQEDIARSVARALRLTLGGRPLAALRAARSADIEAYEYYLRGRRLFLRDTRRDLEAARRMFDRTVTLDPGYARGYAGLADTLSFLYKHFDRDPALLSRADRASRTAIDLDPRLADAHTSRAVVDWIRNRLTEAAAAFEEAIRLDPDSFEAHYVYGMCCYSTGRAERAIEAFRRAAELRPDDFQAPNLLAALSREQGRTDEARAGFQRGLALAERHLTLNPDNARARYHVAFSLVGLGRVEEGLVRAREALDIAPDDTMVLYNVAAVHATAGKVDEGIDYLQRAVDAGFTYRPDLLHDPDLASLRSLPRFRLLLDRLAETDTQP